MTYPVTIGSPKDLVAWQSLYCQVFPEKNITLDSLERVFDTEPATVFLVRDPLRAEKLLGFLYYWTVMDEYQIMDIGVAKSARQKGIARALLTALLSAAQKNKFWISLEVKAMNKPAIRLYESLGFKLTGFRKEYYDDGEDGLLYQWGQDWT